MEDLRQALRDFVATSNSGKYQDEATLLSKFPELRGYDVKVLKDFVATSNSGKYATEDELFSKFPEFGQPVKKKEESLQLPWTEKPKAQPKPQQKVQPAQEKLSPFLESIASESSSGFRLPEPTKPAPGFQLPEVKTKVLSDEEIAKLPEAEEEEVDQGYIANLVSSLNRSLAKNFVGDPIRALGTFLEGSTGAVFGTDGKGPISDALIQFGESFNNAIDEVTPMDEEFKGSLSDQFAQAFGQIISLVMTAGATGGLKGATAAAQIAKTVPKGKLATLGVASKEALKGLASPTAVSAGLTMGQSEFDRAKQAGATDDQAFEAFYKNAAVGSVLEQIPVMQFMKRFNQSTGNGVVNYLKTKGMSGIKGGLEEMTTEVLQQVYANKTAQEIYNTNQELFEGVGTSGGIGFGVGFILNAMGARVKSLRKEGRNQEADALQAQINEFESKAEAKPTPVYKVNGLDVKSPDVINDMIDNLDATELTKANIEISNDAELNNKLQDKVVTSSIRQQVKEANPDLNDRTLDAITELEKDLKKLEGNKTQSAKDKAADIRSQIKNLQENQLQEEAVQETIKAEEDAIQEPSTKESVLRPEESQVGLQEVGEGNAKEQAPAQEVVAEEEVAAGEGTVDNTIAADYLLTGGFDTIISTDYLLKGIAGVFSKAGASIDKIRNKYAKELADKNLVDIKNFIGTDTYNNIVSEIREALSESYNGNVEAQNILDDILSTPTGMPQRVGFGIESRINSIDQDSNVKEETTDGELQAALERISLPEETGVTPASPAATVTDAEADIKRRRQEELTSVVEPISQEVFEGDSIDNEGEKVRIKIVTNSDGSRTSYIGKKGNLFGEGDGESWLSPEQISKDNTLSNEEIIKVAWSGVGENFTKKPDKSPLPTSKRKDKIKEKYDAELAALEQPAAAPAAPIETKPVVSAPAKKVVGPESLREEYTRIIAEVRANKDKSLTPSQVEAKAKELSDEYKKLKAEMTAPKPKEEAKPTSEKVVSKKEVEITPKQAQFIIRSVEIKEKEKEKPVKQKKKEDNKISNIDNDIKEAEEIVSRAKMDIEDIEEKIDIANSDLKETLEEIKKKRDELKNKKMSRDEREQAKEDIDYEIEQAKEKRDDLIEEYNGDIKEAKSYLKSEENKLKKLKDKKAQLLSEVSEEEVNYESVKDLDPNDETALKKILGFLDDIDNSLSEFGEGTLGVNVAIPVLKAIVKSVKVLVKAGINIQDAIKRVAAENNMETKEVVAAIKELDKRQMPLTKLREQVKAEIDAAKVGARNVSDAVKAIVSFFNYNANRGNLTRRDMGRVINIISKVKDQASLDKAADKIFDIITNAKTDIIEVSDKKMLLDQIRMKAKEAKNAKKDIAQKRKDIADLIKSMETTGKITTAKAQAIISKANRLNVDNDAAVESFMNYVTNVFEDAAYAEEIAGINAKIAKAKKNINSKIGTSKNLSPLLNKLFAIKPQMIPAEMFDSYKELVDMFGASGAVLDLDNINEVTEKANTILEFIDDQMSTIPQLSDKLFSYDKAVLTEEGALDYSATIEKMRSEEVITDEEYELMRKFKSYILPRVQAIPKTEKELADEKKVLLKQVKDMDVKTSELTSKDEIRAASELIKLAKSPVAESLSNRELTNLIKVLDNINNGYYPHIANTLYESLEQSKNAIPLSKSILKAKMPKLADYAKMFKIQSSKRKSIFSSIKNIPLFNIDEVFGDFKTKDIFNSIFNSLAQNQQRYRIEIEKINEKIEKAQEALLSHYENSPNAAKEAEMKMAVYRIQREFNSNPGDPQVNSAAAYLKATIKASKDGETMYNDDDVKVMEEILKKYGIKDKDGNIVDIDADKLYKSFVPVERKALDVFDEINNSIEDKALFTADVIRGNKVYFLNNYNHLNVLNTNKKNPDTIQEMLNKFNQKEIVSTKAKSLIGRTGVVSPVNLNIFTTVQRGANSVLMDYYLTSPVRVARGTVNKAKAIIEKDGKLTQEKEDVLNAIKDSLELSLRAMLDSNVVNDNVVDMVIKEVAKTGYRSMLAGVPRAATELTSNMAYVQLVARKEFNEGVKLMDVVMNPKAVDAMEVAGSKVISRTYGDAALSGRFVDPSVLNKKVGIGNTTIKTPVGNVMAIVHNATTKKLKNSVEYIADALITTPDKIMMRPLWFGSFSNAFTDITGVKLTKDDFINKIAGQDVNFMVKYKDAIEAASRVADEKVAMAGNVDNPFMNSLRGYVPSDASSTTKSFKMFDNFMTRFTVGEFLTARKGVMAMMNNGSISRQEGAKLLAAVVARMTVYSVMGKMLQEFVYGLILGDDEEEDDKSFAQKLGQGLASSISTLLLGRDFGNSIRTVLNFGVEKVNEEYLDFLREGEYDPYEDAIQYNFIAPSKGKAVETLDVITAVSGPYSPALKSLDLVITKATEPEKKESAAIERQQREIWERIPLEVFGNLGYVPLYKDVRNLLNRDIYKGLKKELEGADKKEEFKPMGLDRADLKRYYPEVYEKYYGEGTQADAKRKLLKKQRELERRIKDEYYQYTPKKKSKKEFGSDGFGSQSFGE